jgi:hypothetical protein
MTTERHQNLFTHQSINQSINQYKTNELGINPQNATGITVHSSNTGKKQISQTNQDHFIISIWAWAENTSKCSKVKKYAGTYISATQQTLANEKQLTMYV